MHPRLKLGKGDQAIFKKRLNVNMVEVEISGAVNSSVRDGKNGKKPYSQPKLIVYGHVAQLTAASHGPAVLEKFREHKA
jgi:hypothetical protein